MDSHVWFTNKMASATFTYSTSCYMALTSKCCNLSGCRATPRTTITFASRSVSKQLLWTMLRSGTSCWRPVRSWALKNPTGRTSSASSLRSCTLATLSLKVFFFCVCVVALCVFLVCHLWLVAQLNLLELMILCSGYSEPNGVKACQVVKSESVTQVSRLLGVDEGDLLVVLEKYTSLVHGY